MEFVRLLVLFVLLVSAAYTDIAYRRIFNWITYPAIVAGLLFAGIECVMHWRIEYMIPSGIGLFVGFIVFYIPYVFGWVSGGDVKLMAAIGALQGGAIQWFFIFQIIFYTSLVGACMALIILIWEKRLLKGLAGSLQLMIKPKSKDVVTEYNATIPYGVAMVAGTIWTLIQQKAPMAIG